MVQIKRIEVAAVQQCHVRLIVILAKVKIRIQMESLRMALKIRLVQHLTVQITQQQIAQIQLQAVPTLIRVASVHTQIVQVHLRIVLIPITRHPTQGNQALAQVVPLEGALHLLKRRNQYGQLFSTTPSVLFSIS